ncbi:TolC family protein [Thalassomonas sp. M1454]|uniref:TolC family protein n=1 Tax=Thalassomonas sp. M1454 TaxID=2594477 RepID=UPI00117C1150|nr:TolC family protein [Thalassomonas sp. M1454]TRX54058.1 TolC family protein [Thalassomonas sp. M1454]
MFNLFPRSLTATADRVSIKLLSVKTVFTVTCALFALPTMANDITTNALSFSKAIRVAQQNDPWLAGNFEQQKSLESLSTVSNSLPDPQISIGVGNLAADSLEFDQEPMSQFKVGIKQMFPRGNSQEIKSKKLQIESQQYPFQRQDRKAKVAVTVGNLWLDAFKVQQTIALIKVNVDLLAQLLAATESDYTSAKGKVRQHDVVKVQVEIIRLEDKLVKLELEQSRIYGQLSQWLSDYTVTGSNYHNYESVNLDNFQLVNEIPNIELSQSKLVYAKNWLKQEELAQYFSQHPSVMSLNKKLLASQTGVNLAKQKYQPEWGVTASYAYRDDDPMGNERSDLLSIGVVFDLPLFTENRQDQEVKSAISQAEMIKTEKSLLLRKMMSSFSTSKGRLTSLLQRKTLYSEKLIPQLKQQIDSALKSYSHEGGPFSDVLRAKMALVDSEVEQLAINVTEQKLVLELNYLMMQNSFSNNAYLTNNNNSYSGANYEY